MRRGFQVAAERCGECLFGKGRIVSEERMRQLLAECKRTDTHFICHKHTLRHIRGQATEHEANVCCRAFYDRDPAATNFMRIARGLDMVVFVDESGNEVKPS